MTTRTLRFFGSTHNNDPVELLVTLGGQKVFHGQITQSQSLNRVDYLFEAHNIPLDFSGSLPMIVSVTGGTVTLGQIQITHDRILNPIYNHENLVRFQSAVTWTEKVSILTELACPVFSQDQIIFLSMEDPACWAQQEKTLNRHGCELTVLGPKSWRDLSNFRNSRNFSRNQRSLITAHYNDPRHNVTINEIPQTAPRGPNETGTWSWTITAGDVMCCDLMISAPPTEYDIDRNILGEYTLPKTTMDFLNEIQLTDELKRPGITILDIGTGGGEMLQELRDIQIQGRVHGSDTLTTLYELALNNSYDEFIPADLRYPLPMLDSSYDVVVCANVFLQSVMELENNPRMTADCLDEILRILTPGGLFICSIDRLCWQEFDQKIRQLIDSDQISILGQKWVYPREKLYMFPPSRLCMAVRKH